MGENHPVACTEATAPSRGPVFCLIARVQACCGGRRVHFNDPKLWQVCTMEQDACLRSRRPISVRLGLQLLLALSLDAVVALASVQRMLIESQNFSIPAGSDGAAACHVPGRDFLVAEP